MSPTVSAASTVETAAAAEASTTVETTSSGSAHYWTAAWRNAGASTEPRTRSKAGSERRASSEARPKSGAAKEAGAPMKSAKPRTGANKNSAGKPFRTVKAVWRAGVWVIVIVSIRANRRRAIVARIIAGAESDSDTDANSLCACERCCE